jgi:hypothetical protein
MKKIFLFISFLLGLFFLINILLGLIWFPWDRLLSEKIYRNNRYPKEILNNLEIDYRKSGKFYNEMWAYNFFEFQDYIGYIESKKENQEFVNFSFEKGRKINNPETCKKKIYFYGSSTTFGYQVKDDQTIPFYFLKLLNTNFINNNYCVYNFGAGEYNSSRENSLFLLHIINNKISKNDIIIFLDGAGEMLPSNFSNEIKKLFDGTQNTLGNKIIITSEYFFKSLPLVIFYNKIDSMLEKNNNFINPNELKIKNVIEKSTEIFLKNIQVREAICEKFGLSCYTFLEPYSYAQKEFTNKFTTNSSKEIYYGKNFISAYDEYKKIKTIIDISEILSNSNIIIKYIDDFHYSPNANQLIAKTILDKIEKKDLYQ